MSSRVFTKNELSSLVDKQNLHLVIHGKVYDVSEFIKEHPGGDLVMLGEAGGDASEAFDDIEHSEEAKGRLPGMLVGVCPEYGDRTTRAAVQQHSVDRQSLTKSKIGMRVLAAVFLAGMFFWMLVRRH